MNEKDEGKEEREGKERKEKKEGMKEIAIDSLTLHCSTADQAELNRAFKLLSLISGARPVKTLSKKRIPTWKIRPGMPIGCKVTLRKQRAVELLKKLLAGISELSEEKFSPGFLSFGIKEYIQVPSIPYQRDIGIMGFDVTITLCRPGFRIKKRKRTRSRIPARHRISKAETIEFFKKSFNVKVEE